jgi:hypothetical protein
MGRRRKTPDEKANTLPAKYRPDSRVASWALDWTSELGVKVMGELVALSQDLGGWANLSRQRQILVEKVVFLYLWTVQYETALFEGKPPPFDHGAYFNKVNTLHGHLKTLGLERRAKQVKPRAYLGLADGCAGEVRRGCHPCADGPGAIRPALSAAGVLGLVADGAARFVRARARGG